MEKEFENDCPRECSEVVEFFENLPSPYPQVYENIAVEKEPHLRQVILVTGFSGSGKDTVLGPVFEEGLGFHVTTATSRKQRDNEPENAYVWMRGKRFWETQEAYYKKLDKEYDLVESDPHHGNLYGLPSASLKKEGEGIPIVRTDIHGIKTLQEKLPEFGFQPISIGIMPDTWEQVYESIMKRNSESPSDAERRLQEDIESSHLYSEYINYFIHNSRDEIGGRSGLDLSIEAMEYLIKQYV